MGGGHGDLSDLARATRWTVLMVRPLSADALDIIATGAHYATRLTIEHPGSDPVEVEIGDGWSVSEKAPLAGPRLGITGLELLVPPEDVDYLFEFAGYPGAVYRLSIGIVLGATIEWVTVFTGYVVEGSSRRSKHGVSVSLADGWSWSDRVPFYGPFTTVANVSRAATIIDMMSSVAVGFGTEVENVGGYITTPAVYTGSRGQAVAALAADGLVQAGFNADGDLVIKAQHDTTVPLTPDWTFRTGSTVPGTDVLYPSVYPSAYPSPTPRTSQSDTATIVAGTLERTRPWAESLFNGVIVKPGGSEQTWTAQEVELSNVNDPRHWERVGWRPYEMTSDTITTACDAWLLAAATLRRLLRGTDEKVKLTVLLNPAIEADDVFWVSAMPTVDDAGWAGTYIATSVTHSKSAGTTSIEGVSARGYSIE